MDDEPWDKLAAMPLALLAVSAADVVWILLAVAVVGGLGYLARRIDPHWVAKDGRAFTCRIQPMDRQGHVGGRWREARCVVEDDRVRLVVRGLAGRLGQQYQSHAVLGRAEHPPPRSAVFLLDGEQLWVLRVPAKSRAVDVLDSISQR